MKTLKDQRGFIDLAMVGVVVILMAIGGYIYYRNHHAKKEQPITQTAPVTKAVTPTPAVDAYAGWISNTISPEDVKLKFPSDIILDKPTKLVSVDTSGSSVGEYHSSLGKGYNLQVEMLSSPSTNNSYGNLEGATQVSSFTSQGTKYYIVNSYGLFVSTCPDKVCAYTAHSNNKYGMLILITYADPSKTEHQSPDEIPLSQAYVATLEKSLQSLAY